nr:PREDICTED: uncharacterized protein LOC109030206 [Bemisia tabaci]
MSRRKQAKPRSLKRDDEEDGLGSDVDEGDKEKLKKEKKDDIQRFISAIGEDLNDGGIDGVSSGDEDDDGLSAGPDSPGIPFSPTSSLKTGSVGLDPDNDDDDDNASLASDGVSSGDEDDDGLSAGPDSPGIPFSPTSSLKTGSVGLDPDNDDDDDNASLASGD